MSVAQLFDLLYSQLSVTAARTYSSPTTVVLELELDDYSVTTFLDTINGGGLSQPTEYTFMLCVNCWQVFEEVRASVELRQQFLKTTNQRQLFIHIIDRLTTSYLYGPDVFGNNFCIKGHDLKQLVSSQFFNCFEEFCQ